MKTREAIAQAKTSHNPENFLDRMCCLPAVQLPKFLTISELLFCHRHNENSNIHDIYYMRVKLCFANLLKSCSIMLLKREIVLPCFVYIFLLAKNICTAYSFIVYLVKILSWYSSKIVLYLPSLLRHDSSFPIAPFPSKLRISSKYKTYQSTS